ncbi:MAG: transcription-repair coupling factor [Bacteroidota bacterium]|nr:transcription-repair coupling factor [Bacteroidota bacterium]MDP4233802.1 transcription-repair coupling factor [Bacteroidota bacterium]MDP4242441.1 transcription-repair coupling factor [Bacteroidota bacterium]MDP4287563.1 transcription-repair coupling factor [Bacteroidota bacterium]
MTPFYRLLSPLLKELPAFESLRRALKGMDASAEMHLTNIPASLDSLVVASACEALARPFLLLSEDAETAERLYDDLARLMGEERLALFSEGAHASLLARERQKRTQTAEATAQLLEAIDRLARAKGPIITIADAAAMAFPLPRRDAFAAESMTVTVMESIGFETLVTWLTKHHFERKQFVESAGDFAVRGGIVDVFPYTETLPIRIEFFGDTIESMRAFDAVSQRSTGGRGTLTLVPNALTESGEIRDATIFDYLAANTVIVTFEPSRVQSALEESGAPKDSLGPIQQFARLSIEAFPATGVSTIDFGGRSQLSYNANLKLIRQHFADLASRGTSAIIMSETKDLSKRLRDLLDTEESTESTPVHSVQYVEPSLSHGFQVGPAAVYAEHELFGRKRERGAAARKKAARTKGISLRELRALKRGDLLVHEDKGIGKFMGLETIEVVGKKQEVVRLVYRDSDVLFVNLDYIGRLSKYSAGETKDSEPKLSKLGSAEWQRTKEKTKKRLKDIARNLIQLYAKRKQAEGFAFSPDDIIQREMEAAFMYEDTPDQAKASAEAKHDMESRHPMDRLICGDVGYGKTEVALRATMKAVLDKKQVAVLVPTTILSEQHFRSFSDRLDRFGVKCASLSRFRSKKEQTAILKDLAEGKIDVLIGTHRILSKDVIFKDLGLLVIDEEHRFGVAAKEKLRELRANVDTLTLTATPIPRTLNFSLLGARDLSIMETPPRNRLPIMTEVLAGYDEHVIAEALRRELSRGGQIYAIHDKVHDIDFFANKLREAAPRARVGIIHGQLPPSSIEKMMRDFLEKKIDILVATKIVESGLDVPNANTIIINRAQNFGLAELYQLRGRVGRSNEQAYAYLIAPPVNQLSQDALRRLEAMEEFSELGAGFQLAMRDLEIRGAGNLLGAEQSGFIADIGFDLYQKTVEEAVEEIKREEFRELFKDDLAREAKTAFGRKRLSGEGDVSVQLGMTALIPETYIEDDAERFGFYQRMAAATTDAQLEEISRELRDRFGPIPEEAMTLLGVARVRERAKQLGARNVIFEEQTRTLRILLPPQDEAFYYQHTFPLVLDRFSLVGQQNIRLLSEGKLLRLVVRLRMTEDGPDRLKEIEEVLAKLTPETISTIPATASP